MPRPSGFERGPPGPACDPRAQPWLHAPPPPLLTGNARRLAQEGVAPRSAERGVNVIVRSLEREGPLSRLQLRERLDSADVPTAGQALVHQRALSADAKDILRYLAG